MDLSTQKGAVLSVAGAGRRTLLALLADLPELPEQLRLCVIDASRLDAPALVSMLDDLAAQPELRPVFVLNKADLPVSVRTAVTRTLALLRERGFEQPELYPVCAEAARLFLLPTLGKELSSEDQAALAKAYDRFGPGESSLSGFAVTGDLRCSVGGREVSPEQLRLALQNTGLPALRDRLTELASGGAGLLPAPVRPPLPKKSAADETAERGAQSNAPAPLPAEKAPLETWFAAIEQAGLEELPALEATLRRLPVNEEQSAELLGAFARRRLVLQERELDRMIASAEDSDCAGLLRLAQQVRESAYPDELREKKLLALRQRYEARELTELRELTLNADQLDLPGLQALIARVNAGPYTPQTRAPYLELLNGHVNDLHRQALAEICRDVDEAERPALEQMRKLVAGRACSDELKEPFLRRLSARADELDLQQLEALTADCGELSVKDLDCLAVTLEADNWNKKYVGRFRRKVALCREAAVYRQVQEELKDLGAMERGEVLELQRQMREKDLPGRFTAEPLERIDERLYRLDMLRLMALDNDFDSMDYPDIDELQKLVLRGDYHERAAADYLERLREREHVLIFANTAARAALVQQLAAQYRVRRSELTISTASEDYEDQLDRFWGGSGLEQPRDIPVFILDSASTLAFSGTRFWYKSGRDLAFMPLDEIERFQGFKQMLTMNLQIVRKDNSYLLTEARLHRLGSAQLLDFLNECLARWPERAVPEGTLPPAERVRPFLPASCTAAPLPQPLTREMVLRTMQEQYAAAGLNYGTLRGEDETLWQSRQRKLLQGFALSEDTELVWFFSSSVLGTNKEGAAIGPEGVYIKPPRQEVRTVPMDEIRALRRAGNKLLELETVSGRIEPLELPAAMEPVLTDYIRGIQLASYLQEQAERGDG